MIPRLLTLLVFISLSAAADDAELPHCFDQTVGEDQLKIAVSGTPIETFKNLKAGMTRDSVVELVGNPTYLCGSGIAYDVYVLGDDREVSIAYIDGNSAWAFVSDAEDSEKRVLFGESDED